MRVGPQRINPAALASVVQAVQVKRQVRSVAEEIRIEAQRLAPVKTGRLRNGIVVSETTTADGTTEYRVGWDSSVPYGPAVEFGTEDTPAQPHLRPAALKVKRSGGGRR